MDETSTIISMAGGVFALLAAAGAIAVLFYRVAQLEKDMKVAKDNASSNARTLAEVRETLATMKTDLLWIRQSVDRLNPADRTRHEGTEKHR